MALDAGAEKPNYPNTERIGDVSIVFKHRKGECAYDRNCHTRCYPTMGRHSYHSSDGDIGDALAGAYMGIAVVIVIITIFLLVKAVNLLIRVFTAYPKNKVLWIALGICVVCSVLAILTKGYPVFVILAVFSFLCQLVIARIVELYYSETFQEKTPLIESVLHRPWWKGTQEQLVA